MKRKRYVIIIISLAIVSIAAIVICIYMVNSDKSHINDSGSSTTTSQKIQLDPTNEATHLSKSLDTEGVYWQRMLELYWNDVETEQGVFNWRFVDERLTELGENEIYPLVTIKPFTNWDQDKCHGEEYEAEFDPMKGGNVKVGKPCDMEAYADFLRLAVERYDGDGINDMPGLTIPVKYWEIMNEPSMQGGVTGGMGEELKFFVGTSSEYLEILKTSYEVIKETDPTANVVQGGQAGMQTDFQEFWIPVLENGGGDYFDIANIHSISTDSRTEDLFVRKFTEFLAEYGLEDKPIWVTEVQFGRLAEPPEDLEEFEILMAKSTVFSLAQGADKLFYIENWVFWNDFNEDMKMDGMKPDFEEVKSGTTHKVYLNLVDKLNQFDEIIILEEEYTDSPNDWEGSHSILGHYKFIKNNTDGSESAVYALWGGDQIPSEITGNITVTDIYGESSVMDASGLVLGEVPVFVKVGV